MRILVTGGAGFIGSHLAGAFTHSGDSVVVLDDLSTGRREYLPADGRGARLIEGDIADRDAVREAVTGVDLVLHLAAFVSVPGSIARPLEALRTNVTGTALLLDESRRAGVRRLIFASSAAVYGEPVSLPIAEDHPLRPLSPYGAHKLLGEHLARIAAATGGPDALSFRFFNVYGTRQRHDSDYAAVIPQFRRRCERGEPPIVYGDGLQTRDFIFVGDVVEAIRRAIAISAPWRGDAFNLARGEATTIRDLASLVRTREGGGAPPEHAPARAGDIGHSVADIGRLRRFLGWAPPTPLEAGLERSAAVY